MGETEGIEQYSLSLIEGWIQVSVIATLVVFFQLVANVVVVVVLTDGKFMCKSG